MSDMKQDVEELEGAPVLNSREKKFLKGLAHSLAVGVQIGKEDLTPSLIDATKLELERHELVKVKIGKSSGLDKKEASEKLPLLTESSFVQLIGKTIVLYKENKEIAKDKRIRLPR